jgi:hypothetical protein
MTKNQIRERIRRVIGSCKTMGQLAVAILYCERLIKKMIIKPSLKKFVLFPMEPPFLEKLKQREIDAFFNMVQ